MGLFGFGKGSAPETAVLEDIVSRYKRLRPIRRRLNDKLVGRCAGDVLEEGGKKLGLFRHGTFVFDTEDESSMLMDYCIYDVYRKGRNAVEQYLCDCPPDPDSDEMACLHAMQHATYALVAVLRVEPGVGCHVRNLYTEETRLLVDMGFSQTAQRGAIVATRLLDFGDFITTSGAPLPLVILDDDELDEWQRRIRAGVDVDYDDPAPLIRSCLQRGASSHVRYEGTGTRSLPHFGGGPPPAGTPTHRRRAPAKRRPRKAVTNRRCSCGSGKMFKNCCGKR